MCVIIDKPAGCNLSRATAIACWERNSDGGGLMFHDGDRVVVRKGFMTFRHFWRAWRRAVRNTHNGHVIGHLRIGTQGPDNGANTHPHSIGRTGAAIVHNGILAPYTDKTESRSDTRIFADDILPLLLANPTQRVYDTIDTIIGTDKALIMFNNGVVWAWGRHRGHLAKDGPDAGVWFSNQAHVWRQRKKAPIYRSTRREFDLWDDDAYDTTFGARWSEAIDEPLERPESQDISARLYRDTRVGLWRDPLSGRYYRHQAVAPVADTRPTAMILADAPPTQVIADRLVWSRSLVGWYDTETDTLYRSAAVVPPSDDSDDDDDETVESLLARSVYDHELDCYVDPITGAYYATFSDLYDASA